MIDYGLFALIVVILALVFLAFHAWRGIKAEGERISAMESRMKEAIAGNKTVAGEAWEHAGEALSLARQVEGTHYKFLLKRIDEAEATTLGHQKQVEVLLEKVASLSGRLTALQRWRKETFEPETTPPGDPLAGEQLPIFPAASVPPQGTNGHGHFGRVAGRK